MMKSGMCENMKGIIVFHKTIFNVCKVLMQDKKSLQAITEIDNDMLVMRKKKICIKIAVERAFENIF